MLLFSCTSFSSCPSSRAGRGAEAKARAPPCPPVAVLRTAASQWSASQSWGSHRPLAVSDTEGCDPVLAPTARVSVELQQGAKHHSVAVLTPTPCPPTTTKHTNRSRSCVAACYTVHTRTHAPHAGCALLLRVRGRRAGVQRRRHRLSILGSLHRCHKNGYVFRDFYYQIY